MGRQGLFQVRLPRFLSRAWESTGQVITEGGRIGYIKSEIAEKAGKNKNLYISRVTVQRTLTHCMGKMGVAQRYPTVFLTMMGTGRNRKISGQNPVRKVWLSDKVQDAQ